MYTVKRVRVTWCQGYDSKGRQRITHPWQREVSEDGKPVAYCNTKGEANEWIAAQT